MILLSNGGTNIQRAQASSDTMLVGTVDGVALLGKTERGWTVKHRALQGIFVSGVTALEDGAIGSLQLSKDFGDSIVELAVDPEPQECDIQRILVHPERPHRIIIANGIVGMMASEDSGATWQRMKMPPDANYPDAIVIH